LLEVGDLGGEWVDAPLLAPLQPLPQDQAVRLARALLAAFDGDQPVQPLDGQPLWGVREVALSNFQGPVPNFVQVTNSLVRELARGGGLEPPLRSRAVDALSPDASSAGSKLGQNQPTRNLSREERGPQAATHHPGPSG